MNKSKQKELESSLEKAVQAFDMDGVLYRLTQIAVKKRNEAADDLGDANHAEENYWQEVLEILQRAQSQLEGL